MAYEPVYIRFGRTFQTEKQQLQMSLGRNEFSWALETQRRSEWPKHSSLQKESMRYSQYGRQVTKIARMVMWLGIWNFG